MKGKILWTWAEPVPPTWGAKLKKKSFGGAKIRKNNKIWGKILILIFFFWENLRAP